MLALLFPQRLDADYRGSSLAPWLLALVVTVKSLQSVVSIFMGHFVAMGADGIPLDTYTPAGTQTVVALFAILGIARLPFYALCVLAIARYRSAIPLMLALLALEYVARSVALVYLPIARTGTAGGMVVNRVLFACMLVGSVLSVRRRGDVPAT